MDLRLTELWMVREVEKDLWKPTFQACYLIPIFRNCHERSKNGINAWWWMVETPNIEFHELGESTIIIRH